MSNYHKGLSLSGTKESARLAVLDFVPQNIKNVITLPGEIFIFEALLRKKIKDLNIYGFEKDKVVYKRNISKKYFFVKNIFSDYINANIFTVDLTYVDFAWLDTCYNPTSDLQTKFVKLTRNVKPGSRIVVTVSNRLRNIKQENRTRCSVDEFINTIHLSTSGKVLSVYNYKNGKSPMSMLFIQF